MMVMMARVVLELRAGLMMYLQVLSLGPMLLLLVEPAPAFVYPQPFLSSSPGERNFCLPVLV